MGNIKIDLQTLQIELTKKDLNAAIRVLIEREVKRLKKKIEEKQLRKYDDLEYSIDL